MDRIYESFHQLVRGTNTSFVRYKYAEINWKSRMLGLVGPRGVGKTTLFLQYIKLNLDMKDTLYVSADNMYFTDHTLIDLTDLFSKQGGKHLFIDEIHKYPNWSRELKQIFDTYPDVQVLFTGSSILDIYKGVSDLSRRAPIYEMQGLSFREYLTMFHGIKVPAYSLEEILAHKAKLPELAHPLPLFAEYLRHGYYPFSQDVAFELELEQVINQTMENDIPQYANMNVSTGRKLKQLLVVIAKSVPFKPVMQKLADVIGVSRNYLSDYLLYIERAGMIAQLRDATGGIRGLGKVEKIYMDNPNLIYALGRENSNVGNIRETFFYNQLRVRQDVLSSKLADFQIDERTFEIGGKNKGQHQLTGAAEGYVVKDDIETGYGNVVPLWSFGLNY
ncbi:MAG: AAA family ATPase [Mediterranea sp.]|jgi:predicted AAA+ superfamily ATPase|nr:AAA family ATPase [Mediterranea sp.]